MDPPRRPLEEMSQDELLAFALDNGITDETDQDKLAECLGALIAAEAKETENTVDQVREPPPVPSTSVFAVQADLATASGSACTADTDAAAAGIASPPVSEVPPSEQQDSGAWALQQPSVEPSFLLPPPIPTGGDTQDESSVSVSPPASTASAGGAGDEASTVTAVTNTAEEPPAEGEESFGQKRELIDTFVGVTQESRSKARQFLNATDWDIDAALNLFIESGGDGGGAGGVGGGSEAGRGSADEGATAGVGGQGGHRARVISEAVTASVADVSQEAARVARSRGRGGRNRRSQRDNRDGDKNDDDISDETAEIPTLASVEEMLGTPDLARRGAYASRPNRSAPSAMDTEGDAGTYNSRYPNGFSEDGVRAPLPNIRDILIRGAGPDDESTDVVGALQAAMGLRAAGAAEEKDTTDWIFDPPEGLSLPSTFIDTRTICKEQKKWLMVNIQDHEEFASHRLNKDVWSNETIQTLLRGNFVFWQRNKTLGQARYYMEKYNLAGEVLPHTAIIDPRTGAQLVKVVGYVEPEDLSTVLLEFLENNNIDQTKAPKLKIIGMGNVAHETPKDTLGKEGTGDERNSPGKNSSVGGVGDGYNVYESFGSEDYEYDDDDEYIGQGSSVDGNDGDSTSRTSTGTSTSVPNMSGFGASATTPNPASPTIASIREPRRPSIGASDRAAAAAAAAAVGAAELLRSRGQGTPAEEATAKTPPSEEDRTSSQGASATEEVPTEPGAGEGVTQVRFRLPNGVTPATIARRFCLQDRVSLLFQYVRNTVEDGTMRPFDLLSGHPPTSLSASKHLTVEAANLSNSAILMRWT